MGNASPGLSWRASRPWRCRRRWCVADSSAPPVWASVPEAAPRGPVGFARAPTFAIVGSDQRRVDSRRGESDGRAACPSVTPGCNSPARTAMGDPPVLSCAMSSSPALPNIGWPATPCSDAEPRDALRPRSVRAPEECSDTLSLADAGPGRLSGGVELEAARDATAAFCPLPRGLKSCARPLRANAPPTIFLRHELLSLTVDVPPWKEPCKEPSTDGSVYCEWLVGRVGATVADAFEHADDSVNMDGTE